MPIVFVLVAILFWITVATIGAFARLFRDTLRWVASVGHGPYGSHR